MKRLNVLFAVLAASLSLSAFAEYREYMGDSTIYATTYIVRGDSVFVKSNPKIVLGEIKYRGAVSIYRRDVEIATFNQAISPDTLRKMDSIFVDSIYPNIAIIKDLKGRHIGSSIMWVKSYHLPVNVIRSAPLVFSATKTNTDFRRFNIKGQYFVTEQPSSVMIINRKVVVTFGIRNY